MFRIFILFILLLVIPLDSYASLSEYMDAFGERFTGLFSDIWSGFKNIVWEVLKWFMIGFLLIMLSITSFFIQLTWDASYEILSQLGFFSAIQSVSGELPEFASNFLGYIKFDVFLNAVLNAHVTRFFLRYVPFA